MDIWEFLQWGAIVCNKGVDPQLSEIEKIIKSEFETKHIHFEIMQSSRVFLKIDTLSDISYVLWDRSYWEIYNLFLCGILNIQNDKGKENRVRVLFANRDYLKAAIFLFLALRIKDGDISKKFTYAYRLEMNHPGVIRIETSLKSVLEDCEIAQFFVAMHEKNHHLLNKDKDREKKKITWIEEDIRTTKLLISNMSSMTIKKYYGMTKGQMLRLLNKVLKDENLKKDILCDIEAFNECLFMFWKRWEDEYSREKIINKCIEGIRVHGYYSSLLNALDIFWNNPNVTVDMIINNLLGRVKRYDISELLFMIQMSSYRFDFEEAMKPDDFKGIDGKNDVLQDITNRFINEQNRKNWINYQIEIDEDKYKLLEWEV